MAFLWLEIQKPKEKINKFENVKKKKEGKNSISKVKGQNNKLEKIDKSYHRNSASM